MYFKNYSKNLQSALFSRDDRVRLRNCYVSLFSLASIVCRLAISLCRKNKNKTEMIYEKNAVLTLSARQAGARENNRFIHLYSCHKVFISFSSQQRSAFRADRSQLTHVGNLDNIIHRSQIIQLRDKEQLDLSHNALCNFKYHIACI
jgi:hypothetical protein